jgi:hypothetical protein
MTIFTEGSNSFFLNSHAALIDTDRDVADSWASKYVQANPAYKWVLGKFVEADNANSNQQFWSLAELQKSQYSIKNSPMNIMHQGSYIVGTWTQAELIYPEPDDSADAAAKAENPYVEVLGPFWKRYFPEEIKAVEAAFAVGTLAISMECISETVTCSGENGCGNTYEYAGRQSDTYCPELNEMKSIKQFNNPHFLAGALILPPGKPGWKNAHVKDLSAEQERVYQEVSREFSHLDPRDWESMMLQITEQAKTHVQSPSAREICKNVLRSLDVSYVSVDERKQAAKNGAAMSDGSYPIRNETELRAAIRLVGRSKTHSTESVKAHIKKRAKALGLTSALPDDWTK